LDVGNRKADGGEWKDKKGLTKNAGASLNIWLEVVK
jgi:hypothetical protein